MAENCPFHQRLLGTLLEAHKTGASAVIRFTRGSEKKQVLLQQGCAASAESTEPDDHLARILVRMELLKRSDLSKISSLMKKGMTSDQAIREAANLRDDDLEKGAREQVVHIVASLFAWEEGEVRCYRSEAAPRRRIDLRIPVPQLLVLAARHAAAGGTVPPGIRTLKGLLAPESSLNPDQMLLPLEGCEALALSQVAHPSALESLLPALSGMGAPPRELIHRLLLLGFLKLVDPSDLASNQNDLKEADTEIRLEELLRQFEVANFYEILSVAPDVDGTSIKTAYHELAMRFHPDRFQSKKHSSSVRAKAEKVFTYITGAYTTLSDPIKRAGYDSDRLRRDSSVEATLQARSASDLETDKMAEALYNAGKVSIARGDFEKAVEQLKECVWARPDIARYHHVLGIAKAENPKLRKEAEQHFLKALEIDKLMIEAHLHLGRLYMKVNLPRKAGPQLLEFLRWNPGHPEAQRLLEGIAAMQRQYR